MATSPEAFGCGLAAPRRADGPEGARDEPGAASDSIAAMLFASVMAATRPPEPAVAPSVKQNGCGAANAASDGCSAAKIWRAGDGPMTAATRASAGGQAGEGRAPPERIVTDLETGELGRLRVVVDRSDAGIRVVLAVSDPVALTACEAQREAMARALQAAGVMVSSVSIARLVHNGIGLAPSGFAGPGPEPEALGDEAPATQAREQGPPRRTLRRLNVIG
jgi:hypothetical protein